jgi:DnaJ-class molecular chaperone
MTIKMDNVNYHLTRGGEHNMDIILEGKFQDIVYPLGYALIKETLEVEAENEMKHVLGSRWEGAMDYSKIDISLSDMIHYVMRNKEKATIIKHTSTCPVCNGKSEVIDARTGRIRPCAACKGTGEYEQN